MIDHTTSAQPTNVMPLMRGCSARGHEDRTATTEASLEESMLDHLDALYHLALRLTSRTQDAEDLVQETVTRALAFRGQFHLGTNLRAWLCTIERSLAASAYRRKRRAPATQSLDEVEEGILYTAGGAQPSSSPEQVLLHMWVDEEIVAALKALPAPYRRAVLLSDVEGLSYAEMAEAMACAPGTVMSRLHRGRLLLRRALSGPDDDPDAPTALPVPLQRLPQAA